MVNRRAERSAPRPATSSWIAAARRTGTAKKGPPSTPLAAWTSAAGRAISARGR